MFTDRSRPHKSSVPLDREPSWPSSASKGRRHNSARLAWLSVDHLPHGLVILGESGTILDANLQAEAILGYPSNGLIGLPISALLPELTTGTSGAARGAWERSH